MALEFKLPDVGEGTTEGEIVRWLVAEGETVALDQPLVEVETDKAVVELPAPRAGKIVARFGREGEVVPVGATLVVIDEDSEAAPAVLRSEPQAPAVPPPAAPAPMPTSSANGVQAAPFTRRLAREAGIALESVTGTGPRGRIVPEDVRAAQTSSRPSSQPGPADEKTPVVLRGIRRRIAEHLVESVRNIPHVSVFEKADVTEWVRLRERLKGEGERRGVRMTYLPMFIKVIAALLAEYPAFNARWEADQCFCYRPVHMGVAVDTAEGLLVPVIRHVEEKTIWDIAHEVARYSQLAQDTRKFTPEELSGSTITVTAGGPLGSLMATPVINYPEVAILGMYRISPEAAVYQGELAIRQILHLSLTFDHRIADGVMAAHFLSDVAQILSDPGRIFTHLR